MRDLYDKTLKSITEELTKDGNYPKYIHRQIKTGVEETIELVDKFAEEYEKISDHLYNEFKSEGLKNFYYDINGEELEYYNPDISDELYWKWDAWHHCRNDGISESITKISTQFKKYVLPELDNLLRVKDLTPDEREKLESALSRSVVMMEHGKSAKKEMMELNKYNDLNPKEYKEALDNWDKHYDKIKRNVEKAEKKYDLKLFGKK